MALTVAVAAGVAGAAVMVIEVAGAHVLAPGFGTGLNAWAAMITVALGSLACGYALGGLVADRWSGHAAHILAAALVVGGVFCAADGLLWESVPYRLAGLGPRLGAVATAAALFLVPFVSLGAVYPLTVRLWTRTADEVGRRSGLLSAVSAVGSLVGAALAGFVLVPTLAIETIFAGVAAALLAAAGAVLVVGRRLMAVGVVLLALALSPFVLPSAPVPEGRLVRRGSLFGPLEVWQTGALRRLVVAGTCQGFAIGDPARSEPLRSHMPHVRVISEMLSESLPVEDGRVLIIGLGAGFMPRQIEVESCETVEIDPAVVTAAEQFFAFDRSRHPVHVADGRAFLLGARTRYDAVVVDALRGIDLPYHLLTRQFFELVRSRLSPEGILVVNYHGFLEGAEDKLLRAIEKTLRAVFDEVDACFCEERLLTREPRERLPVTYGNVIFAARAGGVEVFWPEESGYQIVETFLDERPSRVLTDSHNPVALWCAQLERRRREMER